MVTPGHLREEAGLQREMEHLAFVSSYSSVGG